MVKKLCAITLLGVFAIAGTSFAEGPSFDDLDANHDGMLSKSETAKVDIDFAKADTNKDGKLDKSEYDAAVG